MRERLNLDHMWIHLLYQAMAAVTYAFGTYSLLSRGFTASEVGILLAITDICGFIFQMKMSDFLDNSRKYDVFQATAALTFLIVIVYIFNFILRTPSLYLSIVYVLGLTIFNGLYPLINSLSKAFNDNGLDIHFGVARACGSFSFGITCIAFGFITNKYSYTYVTGSLIVISIILFIVLLLTNRHFSGIRTQRADKKEDDDLISYRDFLRNHVLFILVSIGITCINSGFVITEVFMLPIVEDLGGTSLDSGIIQGIKAIFEVPVIYNFHRIEKRFKITHIMTVAGISHVLKALVLCVSRSLVPVYVSQLLQCTSYALLLPGSISYIDKVMNRRELVRGHAFSAMVSTVIGTVCNSLGGYAIELYGTRTMCFLSLLITAIGTIIVAIYLPKDLGKYYANQDI